MYPWPLGVMVKDLRDGVREVVNHAATTAIHLSFPIVHSRVSYVPRPVDGVRFMNFWQIHGLKQSVTSFLCRSDISMLVHRFLRNVGHVALPSPATKLQTKIMC
jgi:hypothetical protein